MVMPMVDVGVVRMGVSQRLVSVSVGVTTVLGGRGRVLMPVMFIMLVPMIVRGARMFVLMGMAFRQVQPDADAHQGRSPQSGVGSSPRNRIENPAPTKGAVEKYAATLAAPRCLSPKMNRTMLSP
jgi:hypothetical protein